ERAHPMGVEPVPLPDAPHRGGTDPYHLGHRRRGPMGRLMRRRLVGQGNNTIDGRSRQRRDARGPGLAAGEPVDPVMHEALLAAPDHSFALANGAQIAVVPSPSEVRTMIRARHTCFWGLFRSRMIDCKRTQTAGVTLIVIPFQHAEYWHT